MRTVETVLFLVIVATVVATFAKRLRVPAPSLLVVAGVVVGLLPGVPTIEVTPELVSLVVLPPLLFAAGEKLPWRDLRSVWRPVTVLAVGLVVVSAAVVGVVAVVLTPLPVGMAFVLGAVLASTDPRRGDRAGPPAVPASPSTGAGTGREPVQRRHQPAAVPGRAVRSRWPRVRS